MTKIEGTPHGKIDVKRFYLNGVTIKHKCTKCGNNITEEFDSNYISYPFANTPFKHTMYCYECGNEDEITIKLNVSLELIDENNKSI